MLGGADLDKALRRIKPASFDGALARRVGLEALLTPLAKGGSMADIDFLYASRRRNRFTPGGGPKSIYFGETEEIGSAESKREALLGDFGRKIADPACVFWAQAYLPDAVLDVTDAAVLKEIGTTDEEIHDPDFRDRDAPSASEVLGKRAFMCQRFAAIKYWSVRARAAGNPGYCFCVFKTRVEAPHRLELHCKKLGITELWGGTKRAR